MDISVATVKHRFLAGGGEMGLLTKEKDWNKTAVGDIDTWPQSLRTTLSILLNSKFPMFLFWGSALTCYYNDGYRPSLGNEGKHPGILGMAGKDAKYALKESEEKFSNIVMQSPIAVTTWRGRDYVSLPLIHSLNFSA